MNAFGSVMPGRSFNNSSYRYGFNGKEKDDEVKGSGNSIDFGARMYDPRLGRWLSLDPMQSKYPSLTPYNYCENNPVFFTDVDGMDAGFTINGNTITYKATIVVIGAKATSGKAEEIQRQITDTWGKSFTYTDESGKQYNVKFDIQVKTAIEMKGKEITPGETNLVRIADKKDNNGNDISYVGRTKEDSWYGVWKAAPDKYKTYAHETGHFLGLADQYAYAEYDNPALSGGEYVNLPSSAENDIMGLAATHNSQNANVSQRTINSLANFAIKNQDKNGKGNINSTNALLKINDDDKKQLKNKGYDVKVDPRAKIK